MEGWERQASVHVHIDALFPSSSKILPFIAHILNTRGKK